MTPIYTHYTETDESKKWKLLGEKYKDEKLFYVIHELFMNERYGQASKICFVSKDKERTKQKVKSLEKDQKKIVVAVIRPQEHRANFVYETHKQA